MRNDLAKMMRQSVVLELSIEEGAQEKTKLPFLTLELQVAIIRALIYKIPVA